MQEALQNTTPAASSSQSKDHHDAASQELSHILAARRLLAALYIWQQQQVSIDNDTTSDDIATLQQLAQDIAALLDDLHTPTGNDWTQVNNTQHLRAWYKQANAQANAQIHSIKVHMAFPKARIDHPLTMGWEFDLVQTWNSYATSTHILKAYSDHEILAYCSVWLPYPFAQPHAALRASLWDVNEQHGGWVVHIRSVPLGELESDEAQALHKHVNQDTQRARREITVHEACVLLKQHVGHVDGGDRRQGGSDGGVTTGTMMEAVAHVDPQLPHVPPWLVRFVLTVMMPFVYGSMTKELARVFADTASEHFQRNQRVLYAQVRSACL